MLPRSSNTDVSVGGTRDPRPQLRPWLTGCTAMPWALAMRRQPCTCAVEFGRSRAATRAVVAKVAVDARLRVLWSRTTRSSPSRPCQAANASASCIRSIKATRVSRLISPTFCTAQAQNRPARRCAGCPSGSRPRAQSCRQRRCTGRLASVGFQARPARRNHPQAPPEADGSAASRRHNHCGGVCGCAASTRKTRRQHGQADAARSGLWSRGIAAHCLPAIHPPESCKGHRPASLRREAWFHTSHASAIVFLRLQRGSQRHGPEALW